MTGWKNHTGRHFVSAWPGNLETVLGLVGQSTFRVLLVMASGLGPGNEVLLGVADLAHHLKMTERSVYRHLSRLREKGLIAKVGGRWMVNGRLFYYGRLAGLADNLAYFEETRFEGASEAGSQDDDEEGAGEAGPEPGCADS